MNQPSPSNSQNFNRFSYVLNNPLKYVDPSGFNYQYYIDGLRVSARTARRFMMSNGDDTDLFFFPSDMGANIDNFYPQRLSANADAINRVFSLYEKLTGVAFSYKNGNVGYWSSFSYNSLFKSSEIAGEGWSGVWPSNMTNHGLKFNSFSDVINDQLKAKQSFDEFNQKMSFWAEHNSNSNMSSFQNEDISFGIGIATSMIGEASNIPNPPNWCKMLGKRINSAGAAYGFVDNGISAMVAFNNGNYLEATFQTYQAYGYGAAFLMLQIPITAPFALPVLTWMTTLDFGEYYLKHYLNKRQ